MSGQAGSLIQPARGNATVLQSNGPATSVDIRSATLGHLSQGVVPRMEATRRRTIAQVPIVPTSKASAWRGLVGCVASRGHGNDTIGEATRACG